MFVILVGRVSELIQLKVAPRSLEPRVFGLNDEIALPKKFLVPKMFVILVERVSELIQLMVAPRIVSAMSSEV